MLDIRLGAESVDFHLVQSWLANTYWSPGITREKVERAATGASLVINAYFEDKQVGYCRVISDRATFAYLCDVFVAEEARGKGVAQAMVQIALDHPEHQDLRRWVLATKDAHSLYAKLGFEALPRPENWMVRV